MNTQYVNSFLTDVMTFLLCTSLFASFLALHNAANRYMFALGREGILPRAIGVANRAHQAPSRASLIQTCINVIVIGAFAIAGADPYLTVTTAMLGLGTIGIIVLQAAAAFSVVGFFRSHPERYWWKTVLAPLLGGVGLVIALVLASINYRTLTGSRSAVVNSLPWLLVVAGLGGLGYGFWLRSSRRGVYNAIAARAAFPVQTTCSGGATRAHRRARMS